MKTKSSILTGAAIAALIAATTLTSVASNASVPSSPAERAATAELNRAITLRNNAADEQYRLGLRPDFDISSREQDVRRLAIAVVA